MAWISHEHKLIFLHNPKTGGVAIGNALENKHAFVRAWHDKQWNGERYEHVYEIPAQFAEYSVFTVWRNPFDRVVSWWKFLQQRERKVDPGMGLQEFLSSRKWMRPHDYDARWDMRHQYPFLERSNQVFAFDEISDGIDVKGLGRVVPKKMNASSHPPWHECHTEWTKGFTLGFYGRDFDTIQALTGRDLTAWA